MQFFLFLGNEVRKRLTRLFHEEDVEFRVELVFLVCCYARDAPLFLKFIAADLNDGFFKSLFEYLILSWHVEVVEKMFLLLLHFLFLLDSKDRFRFGIWLSRVLLGEHKRIFNGKTLHCQLNFAFEFQNALLRWWKFRDWGRLGHEIWYFWLYLGHQWRYRSIQSDYYENVCVL